MTATDWPFGDDADHDRVEDVRAVQGWMALDLHMALGKPVDHSATHQGYGSWADWWADLCAEVRGRRALVARVTDHTFEGAPGPGNRCETERFGQTCGAPWEQHELRDDCQHQDPNRLGHRPADLALICACGPKVFPGPATGRGMQPK